MSLRYLCSREVNKLTEDAQANIILEESGIDYNDVPIIIESVATNLGFRLAKVARFKNPKVVAGVVHQEKQNKILKSNLYIAVRSDVTPVEIRYLFALCVAIYVLKSNDEYCIFEIEEDTLHSLTNEMYERLARAILMPSKSLATFYMSPMLQKLSPEERIQNVAKAFLVPNHVAKARVQEIGF